MGCGPRLRSPAAEALPKLRGCHDVPRIRVGHAFRDARKETLALLKAVELRRRQQHTGRLAVERNEHRFAIIHTVIRQAE